MPIREVYLQIFQPCQRELGRLWQVGEITVAQEHYCTAATQLIMSQLAPRLFTTARNGRRAVIACVAGEAHEVGTRMIADLLELDGWDTIFLGGNVPVKSVVQTLVEHRADLLASSATMMYHLPAMIDLIAAVRAEPGCAALKVMVGGRLSTPSRASGSASGPTATPPTPTTRAGSPTGSGTCESTGRRRPRHECRGRAKPLPRPLRPGRPRPCTMRWVG